MTTEKPAPALWWNNNVIQTHTKLLQIYVWHFCTYIYTNANIFAKSWYWPIYWDARFICLAYFVLWNWHHHIFHFLSLPDSLDTKKILNLALKQHKHSPPWNTCHTCLKQPVSLIDCFSRFSCPSSGQHPYPHLTQSQKLIDGHSYKNKIQAVINIFLKWQKIKER